jgi:APA family basic amino acid/polyamine antiporter
MSEELTNDPKSNEKANSAPPAPAFVAVPGKLEQRLGLFSATMIVTGSMIGVGIFINPSKMAGLVQTPGLILGLWVFGGLFTILGALAYGELAAMSPHAGGQYVFLREAFGSFWAFLYGWTLFLVIQTGFIAAVSVGFAKYLGVFVEGVGERYYLSLGMGLEINWAQLTACGVILLLTAVNIYGVSQGALIQNLFTVLKVGALVALILGGIGWANGSLDNFLPLLDPEVGPTARGKKMFFLAAVAVALSQALFAYDAWNTVTFVAEEVRRPERTLPRALLLGTLLTMLVYVLANVAYLANFSLAEMAKIPENRVAAEVAILVFGKIGFTLVVVAILISTFGCVNGLILSGARVCYAMARDGLFFRSSATLHPRRRTPGVALVLQGLWSCVLALTGSFEDLLTSTTFASVLFGGLTVAGVYRLRVTEPDRPRPYRCWGYPVTPALYLLIALPFLIYVIQGNTRATGIGLLLVLTGVPVYFWWRRASWKK